MVHSFTRARRGARLRPRELIENASWIALVPGFIDSMEAAESCCGDFRYGSTGRLCRLYTLRPFDLPAGQDPGSYRFGKDGRIEQYGGFELRRCQSGR